MQAISIISIAAGSIISFIALRRHRIKQNAEKIASQTISLWAALGPFQSGEESGKAMALAWKTIKKMNKFSGKGSDFIYDIYAKHSAAYDARREEWEETQRYGANSASFETIELAKTLKASLHQTSNESIKVTESQSLDKASETPNEKFLGDFLLYNLMYNQFGFEGQWETIDTSDIPENIRGIAKAWAIIYLGWVYKTYAQSKYGKDSSDRIQAHFFERIKNPASPCEEIQGLDIAFNFWFTKLDGLMGNNPESEYKDQPLPFECFAATLFLTLDPQSPHYGSEDIDTYFDCVVGVGNFICVVKSKTIEFIKNSFNLQSEAYANNPKFK
jgi:hypothetical protein